MKTQGRNMGRSLTFNVYAVCRVAFNPSGRDLGSDGRRPQNRTARTADAPQRKCSRSARRMERAATREPTRSPRGRQCEYPSQGDHPQNRRATSQGPAGALHVFNTDGILALSAHVAYVPAGVFILYYETMLTCHISCFLLSRSFIRSLHSGAADVSPAPLRHFGFLKGSQSLKA